MLSPVPSVLCPPRLALQPEQREALSRLLAAPAPAWDALAGVVRGDAALLHAVLDAIPLGPKRLDGDLIAELTLRLERLGADVLRAWLLQHSWQPPPPGEEGRRLSVHALFVGECALHLALETRYPYPDEAYLAGLWHGLGALCLADLPASAVPHATTGAAAALTMRLAHRAGVRGPLADALALHPANDERCLGAHPLARLLWGARRLAGAAWQDEAERVGTALGLPREAVLALRHDVGYLAAPSPRAASTDRPAGLPALASDAGERALQQIVLAGLVRGAFTGLSPEAAGARLAAACRLLCETSPPLVVKADEDERLRALPLPADGEIPVWYGELGQCLDDPLSVIARALRSGEAATCDGGDSRSAGDWHVSRWLGDNGFACVPLALPGTRAVAVIGTDGDTPAPGAGGLLVELARGAAAAVLADAHEAAARDAAGKRVEEHYREHLRRIAHEAANPLSVIKSHLDLIARRHAGDIPARTGLNAVHAELDRIGALLQAAIHPPAQAPEPPACHVPDLLREMHALYAEPLFGTRGIRFELRCAAEQPPAAIPRSALTQVLLNLFRNAAEALHPGGSFIVSVPGQVLADGVPSLELRVIDNGPGLPPERLAHLFAAHPSAKGDGHQGVGLAIVRDILKEWGASVLCRSQSGGGTSFQLFIPLDQAG